VSYLSDELERQLEETKTTGLQLAERIGVSSSQVYNWLNGRQTSISEAQLSAIQAALGDDSIYHARLVEAHLLDERFGLSSHLVTVAIMQDSQSMHDKPRRESRGESALQYLAWQRKDNPDLNELIIDLARLLGADGLPKLASHRRKTYAPKL